MSGNARGPDHLRALYFPGKTEGEGYALGIIGRHIRLLKGGHVPPSYRTTLSYTDRVKNISPDGQEKGVLLKGRNTPGAGL
jgi:hypothetical protein